jgi:hypothetical protein
VRSSQTRYRRTVTELSYDLGPAMALPLGAGEALAGVLLAVRTPGSPPFDDLEMQMVSLFAGQAIAGAGPGRSSGGPPRAVGAGRTGPDRAGFARPHRPAVVRRRPGHGKHPPVVEKNSVRHQTAGQPLGPGLRGDRRDPLSDLPTCRQGPPKARSCGPLSIN